MNLASVIDCGGPIITKGSPLWSLCVYLPSSVILFSWVLIQKKEFVIIALVAATMSALFIAGPALWIDIPIFDGYNEGKIFQYSLISNIQSSSRLYSHLAFHLSVLPCSI
ncbi:MAG TPA: hypothetical protein P5105_00820 [Victivallales bacterium]|nr:hypothetical protein [Victivallales bacterium]HPO91006.1 hypothetical protein [Victivallales bacterium]HRR05800.1 hypothetical protein [Victivallales bacterium]HRR28298.1 hypothetical protein [Victivallales bacterium]HRU00561.1 hypothetical protein [Victivallales bacterium]